MWEPIETPGEWLIFLQRKDIKSLPIMEARKRYMQEQLLFETYENNLNIVNTVSPSVGAAGGVSSIKFSNLYRDGNTDSIPFLFIGENTFRSMDGTRDFFSRKQRYFIAGVALSFNYIKWNGTNWILSVGDEPDEDNFVGPGDITNPEGLYVSPVYGTRRYEFDENEIGDLGLLPSASFNITTGSDFNAVFEGFAGIFGEVDDIANSTFNISLTSVDGGSGSLTRATGSYLGYPIFAGNPLGALGRGDHGITNGDQTLYWNGENWIFRFRANGPIPFTGPSTPSSPDGVYTYVVGNSSSLDVVTDNNDSNLYTPDWFTFWNQPQVIPSFEGKSNVIKSDIHPLSLYDYTKTPIPSSSVGPLTPNSSETINGWNVASSTFHNWRVVSSSGQLYSGEDNTFNLTGTAPDGEFGQGPGLRFKWWDEFNSIISSSGKYITGSNMLRTYNRSYSNGTGSQVTNNIEMMYSIGNYVESTFSTNKGLRCIAFGSRSLSPSTQGVGGNVIRDMNVYGAWDNVSGSIRRPGYQIAAHGKPEDLYIYEEVQGNGLNRNTYLLPYYLAISPNSVTSFQRHSSIIGIYTGSFDNVVDVGEVLSPSIMLYQADFFWTGSGDMDAQVQFQLTNGLDENKDLFYLSSSYPLSNYDEIIGDQVKVSAAEDEDEYFGTTFTWLTPSSSWVRGKAMNVVRETLTSSIDEITTDIPFFGGKGTYFRANINDWDSTHITDTGSLYMTDIKSLQMLSDSTKLVYTVAVNSGGGGGGGAPTKSDVRLKQNVKFMGWSQGGVPKFSYRYIDDNRTYYEGTIAQDLISQSAKYPTFSSSIQDAVVMEDDGYYAVNYDLLDITLYSASISHYPFDTRYL